MTSLDVRMNEGIDRLITQLEAIIAQEDGYKAHGAYVFG